MAADHGKSAGAARRRRAQGAKADKLQTALERLDPVRGRGADDALGQRERTLVAIAMLAAHTRRGQLRNYLHGALQNGITEAELREVMKMLTVYVGFPAAIESLLELDSVAAAEARSRGESR